MKSPEILQKIPPDLLLIHFDKAIQMLSKDGLKPYPGLIPMSALLWDLEFECVKISGLRDDENRNLLEKYIRYGSIKLYGWKSSIDKIRKTSSAVALKEDFFDNCEEIIHGWNWTGGGEKERWFYEDLALSWADFIAVFPWITRPEGWSGTEKDLYRESFRTRI